MRGCRGLSSLTTNKRDVAELQAKLETADIVTSFRTCRDGRRCLRVSSHFYNREEEIAALFDKVGREKVKRPSRCNRVSVAGFTAQPVPFQVLPGCFRF